MSIEHEGKLVRFVCDGGPACHKNYEANGPFSDAWIEARAMGWVNSVSDGVWQHYCPTCKKELGDD